MGVLRNPSKGALTLFPETYLYKAAQMGKFDDSTELERIIELNLDCQRAFELGASLIK